MAGCRQLIAMYLCSTCVQCCILCLLTHTHTQIHARTRACILPCRHIDATTCARRLANTRTHTYSESISPPPLSLPLLPFPLSLPPPPLSLSLSPPPPPHTHTSRKRKQEEKGEAEKEKPKNIQRVSLIQIDLPRKTYCGLCTDTFSHGTNTVSYGTATATVHLARMGLPGQYSVLPPASNAGVHCCTATRAVLSKLSHTLYNH